MLMLHYFRIREVVCRMMLRATAGTTLLHHYCSNILCRLGVRVPPLVFPVRHETSKNVIGTVSVLHANTHRDLWGSHSGAATRSITSRVGCVGYVNWFIDRRKLLVIVHATNLGHLSTRKLPGNCFINYP